MGSPEDPSNFINAVISESAFNSISEYIDFAKKDNNAEIIAGGNYDKTKGYFIDPTIIVTKDPKFKTMSEEIFGPLLPLLTIPNLEKALSDLRSLPKPLAIYMQSSTSYLFYWLYCSNFTHSIYKIISISN